MMYESGTLEWRPVAKRHPIRVVVPVWALMFVAAAGVFVLVTIFSGMSDVASQIQDDINILRLHENRAKEVGSALAAQIADAEQPGIIHSVAVNRLKMHRPTKKEVIYLARVEDAVQVAGAELPERARGGFWEYLFGLVGL